jgi:hypothetical protein
MMVESVAAWQPIVPGIQEVYHPMATINYAQARKICSPEELQIVEATRRNALAKLGTADLKKHVTLARRLRNKWRDLSDRQRRRTQSEQNARVTEDNERSQQKAELFGEVLTRLETQLASLAAAAKGPQPKKPAAGKVTKQVRSSEHRSQRAEVRKKLEDKRVLLTSAQAPAVEPTAPPAVAPAPPADAPAPAQPAAKAAGKAAKASAKKAAKAAKPVAPKAKRAAKKKPASQASVSKAAPPVAPPTTGATSPKDTKQVRVKAVAKQARIQASGLTTRTRGHVSARGKRSQSRRDSRG